MTFAEGGLVAKSCVSLLAMLAVQGTALALAALLLVRVARLRPAFGAAIWLVVLAKFAVPWSPAMPWSFSDLIAYLRHADAGAALTANPIGAAPETTASLWPAIGWIALASAWALGTTVVLYRQIRAYRATLRAARRAETAPAAARALLASLPGATRVRLAVGDAATGPYVVGIVRPVIVVPPALLEDPALLRAALLHELAHVRRKDALGRFVQIWAVALFFWLPVVRFVAKRLDLCREAACDASALEASALSRPAYARLLVKMAGLRTVAMAPALASQRTLDARVAAVLGPPARARIGIVGKIAIVGWAVMALGGARSAAARGDKNVCMYTPQLAEQLRLAHPEADLDGDGTLSKDEACELQAEMRLRRIEGVEPEVSTLDTSSQAEADRLLDEPLCCNCGHGDGLLPPSPDPLPTCHE